MKPNKNELNEIEQEYIRKLSEQGIDYDLSSQIYQDFQQEERQNRGFNTFYEKLCAFSGAYIKIHPPKNTEEKLAEDILLANLNASPQSVIGATIFSFIAVILASIPLFMFFGSTIGIISISTAFVAAGLCYTYPSFQAQVIKVRSQEEAVLAILYMTIYMRLNPVFEGAINFAAQHLSGPLQQDLKNIIWLVENQKVATVQEAIQIYVPIWVKRNPAFLKSLLLLQSTLEQETKEKQEEVLEKALSEILNETYLNMKHYAQDLQMPITLVHVFGMMLPLICLVALPMVNIFLAGTVNMSILFFGYIFILPAVMFFLMRRILVKRPGAFSYPDISKHPSLPPPNVLILKINKKEIPVPLLPLAITVGFIIMIPGLIHLFTATIPAINAHQAVSDNLLMQQEYSIKSYLLIATIPIGLAIACIIYFLGRSLPRVALREKIIEIESDFSDALYQLSNKFNENLPVEGAIESFLQEYNMLGMRKRTIYTFLSDTMDKIKTMSMPLQQALFGPQGIMMEYPSVIISEVMWIIVEGAKRGSLVLHHATKKISIYLQNTRQVKELVQDLLKETTTSISVNAKFMAPFLAGLVGSLSLLIIRALFLLSQKIEEIMRQFDVALLSSTAQGGNNAMGMFFEFSQMVPPTVFQLMVGIYLVETVILLSFLYNGVKNGFDETSRDHIIGKNLAFAIVVYVFVTLIGVIALNKLVITSLAAGA